MNLELAVDLQPVKRPVALVELPHHLMFAAECLQALVSEH